MPWARTMRLPSTLAFFTPSRLSPRKAIWTLAIISAVIGVIAVSLVFGDAARPPMQPLPRFPTASSPAVGYLSHDRLAALPNSLLAITLTSNFGTFILYALSCLLCMIAFTGRPDFNLVKHWLIPGFGLLANLVCMGFYVAGPFFNLGTKMEPLCALGISAAWGLYGGIYFIRSSKAKGKAVLLTSA